ncbi:phosphoserine aminotransferase isoform X2 [Dendroctonus ponderosae]|nr:phosphoserine aminotransferase isoform X2 [Dendroctonus ponderosae]XP_048526571.1 phosphoserine aminotransferase isoform X2 [Dendroctonus ponderosae]
MSSKQPAINFGAGPGKIPNEVLRAAQEEFLSYQNMGFSVTELSHRSQAYAEINGNAESNLRKLLNVPVNYNILFVHGGGQGLFSAVAMNLLKPTGTADYAVAGIWSHIAATEAKKYGTINYVFPKPSSSGIIPDEASWSLNPDASYVYYCDNETIQGIEYPFVPDTKGVPLVVDMSSSIMTKKIDVSRFGVIIAAVQKNLGTAGLGIVIIREDLLGRAMDICPSILNFELLSNYASILNTPPVFAVYLFGKVLEWVKSHGGLEAMEEQSKRKSELLYTTIDGSSGFYQNSVPVRNRSKTNVPIRIKNGDEGLEEEFLREAEEKGMYQLKGHSLVGGIRVSLYNAVSYEDLLILIDFMKEFLKNHSETG